MLHVLILAAGLGTRLKPLTDSCPKPLVPVVDASILEHQVRFVKTLGDVTLHVNAHHLAEKLETEAKQLGFFKVWQEQELLGTGGPIHRMAKEMDIDELLILNGDCFCSLDLKAFLNAARASQSSVALLCRDFSKVNTLLIEHSKLQGIANKFLFGNPTSRATFSGISWYSKKALQNISESERDVRDFWKRLIENGDSPATFLAKENSLWIDMGTPIGLFNAVKARLSQLNKTNWIDSKASLGNNVLVGDNVVIHQDTFVGDSAHLENAVILPGAKLEPKQVYKNQIVGENFTWGLE